MKVLAQIQPQQPVQPVQSKAALNFDQSFVLPIIVTALLTSLSGAAIQLLVHYLTLKRDEKKYSDEANKKFNEGLVMLTLAEKIEKLATKEDLSKFATKEDLSKFATKENFSEINQKIDKVINLLSSIPFFGDVLKK